MGGEQNVLVRASTLDHVDLVRYLVEERKVPLTHAFLRYYQSYFDQARPYSGRISRMDEIYDIIYKIRQGRNHQDELHVAQNDFSDY